MSLSKLVEKWRREADGIHAPPYDDSENSNRALAMHCCADDLQAALSGGGDPVAWAKDTPYGRGYSFAQELLDFLETNPAGAVQVDDAMVERFANSFYRRGITYEPERIAKALRDALNPGGSRD